VSQVDVDLVRLLKRLKLGQQTGAKTTGGPNQLEPLYTQYVHGARGWLNNCGDPGSMILANDTAAGTRDFRPRRRPLARPSRSSGHRSYTLKLIDSADH
jgi:hypothetical protein